MILKLALGNLMKAVFFEFYLVLAALELMCVSALSHMSQNAAFSINRSQVWRHLYWLDGSPFNVHSRAVHVRVVRPAPCRRFRPKFANADQSATYIIEQPKSHRRILDM